MKKVGRPSSYDPSYCPKLIDHMKQGGSFESFGALVHKAKQTLYTWAEQFPEFLDAKKIGEAYSLKFYEDLAKMQAAGQLRRLVSKKPIMIKNKLGEEVQAVDMDGNPLWDEKFEQVQGNAASLIFMLKNMHGWRDKKDIEVSGKNGGPIDLSTMSDKELDEKIEELYKKLKK